MIAASMGGVGLAWLLALAPPTDATIAVRGATSCPSPSEVSAALVGLVVVPRPPGIPDVVELAAQGSSVSVRLLGGGAKLIAERLLPESLPCKERARTAAVIVAAWEARLSAGAPPMWPLPESATGAPPAKAAAPPTPIEVMARPETPPAPSLRVVTAAAVFASVAAGGIAPAGLVEVKIARPGSRVAVALDALAVGDHSTPVASGRGSWHRLGGVVDVQSRTAWTAVELEMHFGLALTAISVLGEGLPTTEGGTIFDPGGLAGLRLGLKGEHVSPWLGATVAFWPRTHELRVTGSSASASLPVTEVLLGVGLSFGDQ